MKKEENRNRPQHQEDTRDDEDNNPRATTTTTIEGQLTSSVELKTIFEDVFSPLIEDDEIVHAFGYGSGVFAQQDSIDTASPKETEERKMLDLILVVKDAPRFHARNQQLHPHHYAPIFRTSSTRAAWWQEHSSSISSFGRNPKVYFNFVDEGPHWMKYGIITQSDLASDLQHWDSLYIGGRMHKPTATIVGSTSDAIDNIMRLQQTNNLPAAVSMAMLLAAPNHPDCHQNTATTNQQHNISLPALYSQISGLSYTGDFRMQMGAEDPAKIGKLVHSPGQLERFHALYNKAALLPLVEQGVMSTQTTTPISTANTKVLEDTIITWNPQDPAVLKHLWRQLPPRFQQLQPPFLQHNSSSKTHSRDWENMQETLQSELHSIVAPAARYQSFKGLWTAGISKSTRYALAKLSKGILRKR